MTDNEIIIHLEQYEVVCDECACNDGDVTGKKIMLNALDLINRQKAEIEWLNTRFKGLKDELVDQQYYTAELQKQIDNVKSETFEQFTERLKKNPSYNAQRGMLCPNCDKALWNRIETKSIFGVKTITVKEQPNFCKYCGQALSPAYLE